MRKRESEFQERFNRWVRHEFRRTAAFELKATTGDALPFRAVEPHQLDALLAAKNGVLVYKIPDTTIGALPFDAFCLAGVPAFVVILFGAARRGQREFFMIDVEAWDAEDQHSKRRSLTEERARVIGTAFFLKK